MIDAILHAVRDAVRSIGYGYDERNSDIMPDGHPRPDCGAVFLAIHGGSDSSTMDNALNVLYGFQLTLTMRVDGIPLDRVGDKLLAKKMAQKSGFNAKCEELIAFLHMNWGMLQDANNYLVQFNPQAPVVYGFCESARYRGMEVPRLVGGEWFYAEPEAADVGLVSALKFEDARRLQAIASFV